MRIVDQVLDQLRADARVDASMLAIRISALGRFRRAAEPYLPADWLEPAQAVAGRTGERLALSRAHTVVAIAGTTGSGKSSLFNALAGMELSPVSVKRPTTGQAYACVWGPPSEAATVLDWLRVPPANRSARESVLDADDQADLRGLILLDLPDFDSIEESHALEVNRLLKLVDLVVWVVDPQKYADRVLHEGYLRRFHQHREVTVVALNQADLLSEADITRLLGDLRNLLAADGLAYVSTMATSAVAGAGGLAQLRATLERVVASRRAALLRLAADVDEVVAGLADLVGPKPAALTVDQLPELINGLAEAGGLPAVTRTVATAYRRRANAVMSWPPLRWLARQPAETPVPVATTGTIPRAMVNMAVRAVAHRASAGLPPPWPDAVAEASRSRVDQLPSALAQVANNVAAASEVDHARAPWWWRLVGVAQWLAAGVVVVALCWLFAGWVLQLVALPVTHPRAGGVSVPTLLLTGGVLTGVALAVATQPLVRWGARRAQAQAARRLRAALAEAGEEYVLAPVRAVLDAYGDARAALHAASPR